MESGRSIEKGSGLSRNRILFDFADLRAIKRVVPNGGPNVHREGTYLLLLALVVWPSTTRSLRDAGADDEKAR